MWDEWPTVPVMNHKTRPQTCTRRARALLEMLSREAETRTAKQIFYPFDLHLPSTNCLCYFHHHTP